MYLDLRKKPSQGETNIVCQDYSRVDGVVQDAVYEQQRNAALILRGSSAGSGPEAGPGSAPDNAGQCNYAEAHTLNSNPPPRPPPAELCPSPHPSKVACMLVCTAPWYTGKPPDPQSRPSLVLCSLSCHAARHRYSSSSRCFPQPQTASY